MGAAIAGCDAIRRKLNAHVRLLHHPGKDTTCGVRGHSSLHGACDTEIEIASQSGARKVIVRKQRDTITRLELAFDLERLHLGFDIITGEQVSSCSVRPCENMPMHKVVPSGKNQQVLLAGLRAHLRSTETDLLSSIDLREVAKAQGIKDRRRLAEAQQTLERLGLIIPAAWGHRFAGDLL